MEISQIGSVIGQLGFPIFCCVMLFRYLDKERESHKEETQKITEMIGNLTEAVIELKATLEHIKGMVKDE